MVGTAIDCTKKAAVPTNQWEDALSAATERLVMSALSAFVIRKDGRWVLAKPDLFKEEELIRRAVQQFRALDREVTVMGRSEAAYDALSIYTETIAAVLATA